jgi:hypothetical protein
MALPIASDEAATVPDNSNEEPVVVAETQSVLSNLRDMRGKLGSNSTPLDLAIPGYEGLLVLRCKWIPFKDLSKHAQKLNKIDEVDELRVAAAADTLSLCCQEILIRVEDELRPMSEDSVPVTFGDPRIAQNLGFPFPDTTRETVRAVFANDYAMMTTAESLVTWLQDTTASVNDGILGNS